MTQTTNALSPQNLRDLIDETHHHREEECKGFLRLVPQLLIRDTFQSLQDIINVRTEFREHTGDSDYIISANVSSNGRRCPKAYVWEVKAPQCFVFEKTTDNRARPSTDLIEAETQLLTYYDELKGTPQLLHDEFDVGSSEDLGFGGIIIGCIRTRVSNETVPQNIDVLFNRAIRCRNYLYEHAKGSIRLMLWDEIHNYISAGNYQAITRGPLTTEPLEIPTIPENTISVMNE